MKHYVVSIGYQKYCIHPEDVAPLLAIANRSVRVNGYGPLITDPDGEPFISAIELNDVQDALPTVLTPAPVTDDIPY